MPHHQFVSSLRARGYGAMRTPPDVYIVEVRKGEADHIYGDVEWLLVERQEHLIPNGAGGIAQAKLCIQYWSLNDDVDQSDAPAGEFVALYDEAYNGVSLSSHSLWHGGYVVIEPERLCGLGLGTYFMNKVVAWAKQWPDAQVRQIKLPSGECRDKPAQQLRLHFYGRFGIKFDFPDNSPTDGIAYPMRASELTLASGSSKAIAERNVVVFLRELIDERSRARWEINALKRNQRSDRMTRSDAYRQLINCAFMRLVVAQPARALGALVLVCAVGLGAYRIF